MIENIENEIKFLYKSQYGTKKDCTPKIRKIGYKIKDNIYNVRFNDDYTIILPLFNKIRKWIEKLISLEFLYFHAEKLIFGQKN